MRMAMLRNALWAAWTGSVSRSWSGCHCARWLALPGTVLAVSFWRSSPRCGHEQIVELVERCGAGLEGAGARHV